ncbi:exo-alpha-sialidase [Micromonospora carbonacea]|uniref:exo-alpha-sialidase n=1 Tax=Micromonospora carbonacea TaxID=47853 RepID=UPI003D75D446
MPSSTDSPVATARLGVVRRIGDAAGHNAFTDLVRHRGRWLCAYREGAGHLSADGAIRVLASADGREWAPVARLERAATDLRDPRFVARPDGRLQLLAAAVTTADDGTATTADDGTATTAGDGAAVGDAAGRAGGRGAGPAKAFRTLTWLSADGQRWGEPTPVGERDIWVWQAAWHGGAMYGVGYATREPRFVRLYRSGDGLDLQPVVDTLFLGGYPNESGLVLGPDGTATCLLRRDREAATAQLGRARPPYRHWTWTDLGVRVGGPALLGLPDGRLVAGVRLLDGGPRTAVCAVDPHRGALTELLALPSGGDCGYPGLDWHDGLLRVSYYSSHEERTCVYLAEVTLDG